MVNASLRNGDYTSSLKKGIIHPSISKQNLDQGEFSSYRPITYVAFLSKTLERVAAAQTINFLTDNDLMAKLQSAYRSFHSNETALLSVCVMICCRLADRKLFLSCWTYRQHLIQLTMTFYWRGYTTTME